MLIEDMLADLGHELAAVASRIPEAIEIAQQGTFDFAILDVNLDGEPSYPIATILRDRNVPFIFSTGYGKLGIGPEFAAVPLLTKPFARADLERALSPIP